MNSTKTNKNKMRKWVAFLALIMMIPSAGWAQYKIYVPPKVYTPPKVSTPRTTSQPKASSSKQPKTKQSQVKQPKEKRQSQPREAKPQKADRRQKSQEVKRARNGQKQERQEQKLQQKQQQRELKQQRKENRQQGKARRNQKKQAKRQGKQRKQDTSSPPRVARIRQNEARGQVTPLKSGGHAIDTPSGEHYEFNRDGKLSTFSKPGMEATFRPDGKFRSVKADGMQIDYRVNGARAVQTQLPGGGRLVSTAPNRGFIEYPMTRGGQAYIKRTYVANGRISLAVYRAYYYHSVPFYHYVPAFYFSPRFYMWAFYPWGPPITFSWGWFGAPWFGFYGPYFAPFPAYPNASLWLTDYLLAANLAAAYQDRAGAEPEASSTAEAYAGDNNDTSLTPEVKFAIAAEVRQQLAAEQAMATDPTQAETAQDALPPGLDPTIRVFVVSSGLSEGTADSGECGLTPGDVIARLADGPDVNQGILVIVLSSKQGDCAAGSQLRVSAQDLQEMHNDFCRQIDSGLGALAQEQGQGGLPASPNADPRLAPNRQAGAPDANAPTLLQQQWEAADRAEADIRQTVDLGSDK